MNTEEKNIETCLAESILAEVASVPTDAQFRSLVNESLDPLKQQAANQTGWDAYEKVVWTHRPYTFTSSVRQMKSNLILLLRRLWRFPFGRGAIRSLSDMWAHYITRLQGSETYGIPSRLAQLTDLPSAPLLVADRKISAGESDVPDGMSLLQLVLSSTSGITKLSDPYVWDVCYRDQLYALITALPSLNDLSIRCKRLDGYSYAYNVWFPDTITKWNGSSDVFEMPDLERFEGQAYIGFPTLARNFKIWSFPKMKWSRTSFAHSYNGDDGFVVDWVEQVLAPNCDQLGAYGSNVCLCNFTNMWKAVFGNFYVYSYGSGFLRNDPKLIHLEFGAGGVPQSYSLGLGQWNPSYVLSDNPTGTDLIEEGSTAQNNLQQFLQNFRDVLFTRLAKGTSTTSLTLTLSPEVYKAVYGLDADYNVDPDALAQTASLANLGITTEDLNEIEIAAGITTATKYATWLDTYRGAIYWNVQHS